MAFGPEATTRPFRPAQNGLLALIKDLVEEHLEQPVDLVVSVRPTQPHQHPC